MLETSLDPNSGGNSSKRCWGNFDMDWPENDIMELFFLSVIMVFW